jgi:hypothetical protein
MWLSSDTIYNMAVFLATIGVALKEADSWRLWAVAYVQMKLEELKEHPYTNSSHIHLLRRVKDEMQSCIDQAPRLAIRGMPFDALGNYNPVRENAHTLRCASSCPSNAEAGPSRAHIADPAY